MTQEEKNTALGLAWDKICDWTKKNATGFEIEKRFRLPHNVYHWMDFVIMPDGEARIYYGGHGSDNPERVLTATGYYEGTNGRFQIGVKTIGIGSTEQDLKEWGKSKIVRPYSLIEGLVNNWDYIKALVLGETNRMKKIKTFEP